jgi:hypothetical protein
MDYLRSESAKVLRVVEMLAVFVPSFYLLVLPNTLSLYAHRGFILIRSTSTVSGTAPIISVSLSLSDRLVSDVSMSEDETSVSRYTTLSGMTKARVVESPLSLLLVACKEPTLLTLMLGGSLFE